MREPYRTAIVGTGAIADAHARAVHAVPERARLVAAVEVDVPRAKEFARTWDVPATYGSVAELLANDEVDLVHVCTPPRSHLPVTLECLAAGVTVLVEKPPVVSLSEMDLLAATESHSAGHVAAVFQHRFGSAAVRLRRLAADGVLGRWEQVTALAARQSRPTETEDVSMAMVRFENGAVAPVVNSLADARDTVEFIAALYESAFTGRPVRRGEVAAAFAERMDGTGAPWQLT